MEPQTLCFTSFEGVIHAHIDEDYITFELKRDGSNETVSVTVPAFKFAWVVDAFNNRTTKP